MGTLSCTSNPHYWHLVLIVDKKWETLYHFNVFYAMFTENLKVTLTLGTQKCWWVAELYNDCGQKLIDLMTKVLILVGIM